jgi:hypothetical protein
MRQNLLRCWSRGVICGSAALSQSSCVPKSGHFGAATEKTTRAKIKNSNNNKKEKRNTVHQQQQQQQQQRRDVKHSLRGPFA